eukprot:389902-Amphidinium_carterae.1
MHPTEQSYKCRMMSMQKQTPTSDRCQRAAQVALKKEDHSSFALFGEVISLREACRYQLSLGLSEGTSCAPTGLEAARQAMHAFVLFRAMDTRHTGAASR